MVVSKPQFRTLLLFSQTRITRYISWPAPYNYRDFSAQKRANPQLMFHQESHKYFVTLVAVRSGSFFSKLIIRSLLLPPVENLDRNFPTKLQTTNSPLPRTNRSTRSHSNLSRQVIFAGTRSSPTRAGTTDNTYDGRTVNLPSDATGRSPVPQVPRRASGPVHWRAERGAYEEDPAPHPAGPSSCGWRGENRSRRAVP